MRRAYVLLHAGLLFFSTQMVAGQEENFERPKYQVLRFDEDWSKTPKSGGGDWLDPLKKIDFDSTGRYWLSLGGQARFRYERWNNFLFAPAGDGDFVLRRFLLHADFHLTPLARIFIEGRAAESSTRNLSGGKRTSDVDTTDVQNAFLDLNLFRRTVLVRAGRQGMAFGAVRLVSSPDWGNVGRTFDGFRTAWTGKTNRIDAFYVRPVLVYRYESNRSDDTSAFYGFYGTVKSPKTKRLFDYYVLTLHTNPAASDMERYTPGARFAGSLVGNLSVDAEVAMQFGEMRAGATELDIGAGMAALDLRYLFKGAVWEPLVTFGYDYASGDESPLDGENGTFNQLYTQGHAYLGWVDVVGRQNIQDYRCEIKVTPIPNKVNLRLEYHQFYRAEENDGLYNSSGVLIRAAGGSANKEIGQEYGSKLEIGLTRHLSALLGYSYFNAGGFIKETSSSAQEDIEFSHASLTYTF